jgi:hypothetical protein
MFAGVRGELLPAERDRINPDIVWNIEKGLKLSGTEIISAQRARDALFHRVARFFDEFNLLACPTVAVPPFVVEQRFPTEIAGEKLTTYIDWMFLTFVITLTGCPAISLPCGLTKDGLPIGLQLVGRPHGDADLLGMARLLEEALAFKPKARLRHCGCTPLAGSFPGGFRTPAPKPSRTVAMGRHPKPFTGTAEPQDSIDRSGHGRSGHASGQMLDQIDPRTAVSRPRSIC